MTNYLHCNIEDKQFYIHWKNAQRHKDLAEIETNLALEIYFRERRNNG